MDYSSSPINNYSRYKNLFNKNKNKTNYCIDAEERNYKINEFKSDLESKTNEKRKKILEKFKKENN